MIRIGVIGLGGRAMGLLKVLAEIAPTARVAAIADPDEKSADQRLSQIQLDRSQCHFFREAGEILRAADSYDAIIIGTRCNLHASNLLAAMPTGLPILLEKPVVINWEQWEEISCACEGREHQVLVSFPLRFTPLFQEVKQIVGSGRLGKINQIQAVNNVNYGGVYYANWYRDAEITGGLWLQKATHDFDYMNQLHEELNPITITAVETRRIFGGDMPHTLRCSQCTQTATCPESPKNLIESGDDGGMLPLHPNGQVIEDHWCVFSGNVQHQDSGSALIRYDNGAHACYSQNFVSRRTAHSRGATITGYDATLRFNWADGKYIVIDHRSNTIEEKLVPVFGLHNGGDRVLMQNLVDMVQDQAPPRATIAEGLKSAELCLGARDSSADGSTYTVKRRPKPPRWQQVGSKAFRRPVVVKPPL